jgi:hypothetical protein
MDDHLRRIGENEVIFREVNERVRETQETFEAGRGDAEFVCECGDPGCVDRIRMTLEEYEELRSDPTHFAIRPGHEIPEVETVVQREGRYDVVRKLPGGPEEIAISTDPRS